MKKYFLASMCLVLAAGALFASQYISNQFTVVSKLGAPGPLPTTRPAILTPGMCHDPIWDADGDLDVDDEDLAIVATCTGVAFDPTTSPCGCFDINLDGKVDGLDMASWENCRSGSGPGVAANPECDNIWLDGRIKGSINQVCQAGALIQFQGTDGSTGRYKEVRTDNQGWYKLKMEPGETGIISRQSLFDKAQWDAILTDMRARLDGTVPQSAFCVADLDQDNDVDGEDYAIFQSCFNGPNNPSPCPLVVLRRPSSVAVTPSSVSKSASQPAKK